MIPSPQLRRVLATLIGLALMFCPAALVGATDNNQPPQFDVKPKSNVFLAYGDPRFTDPQACEVSDPRFRRALVDRMAHEDEKPDFLIITGDVVHSGDNDHDWRAFDEETKALKDQNTRVFAVLGNHEVQSATG